MKSTIDKLEGLSRKIKIDIPAEKVNDAFLRVYRGIQQNATIKGFRKGKAPINKIRAEYQDRVQQDVLQDLLAESYQAALIEHSLDPIGQPKINFDNFGEDQSFSFSAELEIRPEINLNKYEGLKATKEKIVIEDKQIDEALENIRQSRFETVPVFEDRPAQTGDVVKLDFEGFMNDAPLDGGNATDHQIELGSQSFIPGFEDAIVGMTINSNKEIHLSFPEDYHATELAGKPITFQVTLKAIEKKVLPELNDEFAKSLGEQFETLDQLKQTIKQDMEANEKNRVDEDLKKNILEELVKENPIEIPAGLKQQQKQALINDVQSKMHQQGLNNEQFEEYKSKWDEDFEKTARFMIHTSFLIDALADKLDLRATEKDVDEQIKMHALQTGLDFSRLKEFYSDDEKRSNLRFKLTEDKVVDYLIDKAEVQEVSKDQL